MKKLIIKTVCSLILGTSTFVCAGDFLKENKFSHEYHVGDEELSCVTCHTTIDTASSISSIGSVHSSVCTDCHEDVPKDQNISVTFKDKSFLISKRSKKGELFFSHKAHLKRDSGSDANKCASCHGTVDSKTTKPATLPSMTSCMNCHTEKKADNSCTTCHPSALQPVSHKTGLWMKGSFHGRDAAFKKEDCTKCHSKEESCSECHQGTNNKKIHSLNYKYTHGMDVKFKTKDCATCHTPVQQFCGDCHFK